MCPVKRGSGAATPPVTGRNYVGGSRNTIPRLTGVQESKLLLDAISLQLSKCLCGGLLRPVSPCWAVYKSVGQTVVDTRKAALAGGLRWNEN
jgi:hypothetical protein